MARRRANNEGSIYKDGDRWVAALVIGRHPNGRLKRRRFTARTRKEVTAKLEAAKAATQQGLDIPDDRATIEEYGTWWADHVLPGEGLAPKTESWYRDTITHYVLPHVGHRTLTGHRALTPGDVEAMCAKLRETERKKKRQGADPDKPDLGYSHRVAQAARTTLGKMLRDAEQRGRVGRNVARLAKPPGDSGKARPVKAHTSADVEAILSALDGTRWHPIVVVGVTTGLRPGELLALHWPDLHLTGPEPYLSVRHALSYPTGSPPTLKAPKRERSYRTVPLAPEAVTALKARRKAQAAEQLAAGPLWSPDRPGLVFTAEAGTPLRVDVYRQTLNRVLPGSHPHRLRHTYATHLLEAGTPTHHVAELLGDSVATVEATYSHVLRTKHEVVHLASGLVGGVS